MLFLVEFSSMVIAKPSEFLRNFGLRPSALKFEELAMAICSYILWLERVEVQFMRCLLILMMISSQLSNWGRQK